MFKPEVDDLALRKLDSYYLIFLSAFALNTGNITIKLAYLVRIMHND